MSIPISLISVMLNTLQTIRVHAIVRLLFFRKLVFIDIIAFNEVLLQKLVILVIAINYEVSRVTTFLRRVD